MAVDDNIYERVVTQFPDLDRFCGPEYPLTSEVPDPVEHSRQFYAADLADSVRDAVTSAFFRRLCERRIAVKDPDYTPTDLEIREWVGAAKTEVIARITQILPIFQETP